MRSLALATAPRPVRRRVWVALALAASALLAACSGDDSAQRTSTRTPTPTGPPLGEVAPTAGLNSITETELRATVELLASPELGGRGSGQGGDELAARALADDLAACGLRPEGGEAELMQRFSVSSGSGYTFNVVGYWPGSDSTSSLTPLVIGAHYDHLGIRSGQYYPGADDNASGTALIVEVAQALKAAGGTPRRPVIFAAFGGEELGLVGSRQWVTTRYGYGGGDAPRPLFMINADMVGHVASGQLRLLGVSPSEPLAVALQAICQRQGLSNPVFSASAGGGSDHVPFQGIGVPVVFFHTGLHADYHTPRDLPATLDFAGLTTTTRIVYELAWNLANAKSLPTLSAPPAPAPEAWQADHGLMPFRAPVR